MNVGKPVGNNEEYGKTKKYIAVVMSKIHCKMIADFG